MSGVPAGTRNEADARGSRTESLQFDERRHQPSLARNATSERVLVQRPAGREVGGAQQVMGELAEEGAGAEAGAAGQALAAALQVSERCHLPYTAWDATGEQVGIEIPAAGVGASNG